MKPYTELKIAFATGDLDVLEAVETVGRRGLKLRATIRVPHHFYPDQAEKLVAAISCCRRQRTTQSLILYILFSVVGPALLLLDRQSGHLSIVIVILASTALLYTLYSYRRFKQCVRNVLHPKTPQQSFYQVSVLRPLLEALIAAWRACPDKKCITRETIAGNRYLITVKHGPLNSGVTAKLEETIYKRPQPLL